MIIQSKKSVARRPVCSCRHRGARRENCGGFCPYGSRNVDDDYGISELFGFLDIHCHGAYGFDTNDAYEDGLRYWAEHIASEGVTGFWQPRSPKARRS